MNARRALTIATATGAFIISALVREAIPAVAQALALVALGGMVVFGGWLAASTYGGVR